MLRQNATDTAAAPADKVRLRGFGRAAERKATGNGATRKESCPRPAVSAIAAVDDEEEPEEKPSGGGGGGGSGGGGCSTGAADSRVARPSATSLTPLTTSGRRRGASLARRPFRSEH